MKQYSITSEAVTEGHPDKICDQISDAVLDAYLCLDRGARVAVETMVSKNMVVLAGEITSSARVDIIKTAREVIREIGYTESGLGFDYKSCLVFTNITTQSCDIAQGVLRTNAGKQQIGGGDQGIMYGYASDETDTYMPLPYKLANELAMRLAYVRKEGILPWLYPDGKAQVTVVYDHDIPIRISSIVVSAQHNENIDHAFLQSSIMDEVIDPVIPASLVTQLTRIHINPTGRFVIGGPAGDTGVTGRKIMVDTYGGIGRHGGGAFSGKDATKVDRSASYMARYAAKNIVAAGLAKRCEVSVAYAIGQPEPESVDVNTFGTAKIEEDQISQLVHDTFSFTVSDILDQLELCKPQFQKTASYGHFGRTGLSFAWEKTDKIPILREKAFKLIYESLNR